jgi:hypothetical protein
MILIPACCHAHNCSPNNASLAILYFNKSPVLPTSTPSFKPPAMVPDVFGEGYISPYQQRMLGQLVPPPATRVSGSLAYSHKGSGKDYGSQALMCWLQGGSRPLKSVH